MAKVALAAVLPVKFTLAEFTLAFTVPDVIVTLASVRLPTELVVLPRVSVAFPSVVLEFCRPELGMTALIWEGAILIAVLLAAVSWP